MNAFPFAVLILAGSLAHAAKETEIHCTDGSRIRGSLLGIETDRLTFEADFLAAPVPLRLNKVLELSLPVHHGDAQGDHVATVTLSNGDVVRGELTGVDETTITLRTWFAGEMKFRRVMVDSLEIQDRPEILFSGPSGLEGWTQSEENAWSFEHGALRAKGQGTIARELELPAKTRFAFDLAWRSSPRFRFLFYTDDIKSDHPENSYELICQGRYVQLHKRWSKGNRSGNTTLGNFANVPELLSKEKCRIELLVDRKTGLIRLIVNGRIAADWTDADPDAGDHGGGMHFNTQDNNPLRVSRIEVTTWDGMVEGAAPDHDEGFMDEDDTPQPATDDQPDPTRIRLRNNDLVAGDLLGIENGKVKLKTAFGEVNLPVSRLRTFTLHTLEQRKDPELYQLPIRRNGDVRAWFPDGGSITFRLASASDGKLVGSAQTFGDVVFDENAFSRIEFNLYQPDLDDLRGAGDAW